MLRLFGLASCDSCRRTRKALEARGETVETLDLRRLAERGELEALLTRWLSAHDWRDLLNRRSTTWRNLPETEREGLDRDRALALMNAHPALIRRPLLDTGETILIGPAVAEYSR